MTKPSERLSLTVVEPRPVEVNLPQWQGLFTAWARLTQPDLIGEVVVSFVTKSAIQALYLQTYGDDRPTDVLSFSYDQQPGESTAAGEIVICPAIARQAARRLKTDVSTELATLFVHGLIHLTNRDHATESDRAIFDKLTHDIMAQEQMETVSLWSA